MDHANVSFSAYLFALRNTIEQLFCYFTLHCAARNRPTDGLTGSHARVPSGSSELVIGNSKGNSDSYSRLGVWRAF